MTPREWIDGQRAVLKFMLAACAVCWAGSVVRFVVMSGSVADAFTALARGPYLSTAVTSQLRVIPAYLLFGTALALVVWPLVARARARKAATLAATALVVLVAAAAQLRSGVLFDTIARKLPALDLYRLAEWRVLDAARWALPALVVAAAALHVRALWPTRARWPLLLSGAGCAAVLALPGVGKARAAAPRTDGRPNILVLATDSWRFDRVGVHGGRPGLTPNIDAFAAGAVDFTAMHVATASTLESWTTLLTGQFPPTHGIRSMFPSRDEVRAVEQSPVRLPALLKAQGYHTFVSSDWAGNCFDLVDLGFEQRHVAAVQNFKALIHEATVRSHVLVTLFFGGVGPPIGDWLVPGRSALANLNPAVVPERVLEEIDASRALGRPFFGVLFASPTHLPYNARYPFNSKYVTPGYQGPNRYQIETSVDELITTGFQSTLPPDAVQHIRDLYDGAVSDFDDTVGQMLRALEARGLSGNSVVIVTTDHGEDLYDPGSTLGHGTNFFGGDQSTHIPFLVRAPAVTARQVTALTRTADFAPTLLDLLGLPARSEMEGVSLVPLLRGEASDLQLTAFAETCYLFFPKKRAMTVLSDAERARVVDLAGATDTLEVDAAFNHNFVLPQKHRRAVIDAKDRMVRTRRWKLIDIPSTGAPIRRLYDMEADPGQTQDLAGQGLDEERVLSDLLTQYWSGK